MNEDKPTHVYIGRYGEDSRVLTLVGDDDHPGKGDWLAEIVNDGGFIERVTWDDYFNKVRHEPTFMEAFPEPQMSLFGDEANKGES